MGLTVFSASCKQNKQTLKSQYGRYRRRTRDTFNRRNESIDSVLFLFLSCRYLIYYIRCCKRERDRRQQKLMFFCSVLFSLVTTTSIESTLEQKPLRLSYALTLPPYFSFWILTSFSMESSMLYKIVSYFTDCFLSSKNSLDKQREQTTYLLS